MAVIFRVIIISSILHAKISVTQGGPFGISEDKHTSKWPTTEAIKKPFRSVDDDELSRWLPWNMRINLYSQPPKKFLFPLELKDYILHKTSVLVLVHPIKSCLLHLNRKIISSWHLE